jgi:hypothetical protein
VTVAEDATDLRRSVETVKPVCALLAVHGAGMANQVQVFTWRKMLSPSLQIDGGSWEIEFGVHPCWPRCQTSCCQDMKTERSV